MKKKILMSASIGAAAMLTVGCAGLEQHLEEVIAFSEIGTANAQAGIVHKKCAALGLRNDRNCLIVLYSNMVAKQMHREDLAQRESASMRQSMNRMMISQQEFLADISQASLNSVSR